LSTLFACDFLTEARPALRRRFTAKCCIAEPLFHQPLVVVAGPRNKWLRRRKITLADLADEPWILTPLEVQPGAPVFEAFRAVGLEVPRASVSTISLHVRNSLLATGRFLTVVPGSVLWFGPERLWLKQLPIELPRWPPPIAVITLKNRTLSPVAKLFIECAREIAKPFAG
jgi:DNA-binding transcriptional LysR family regulator